jgi:hypothetical protein
VGYPKTAERLPDPYSITKIGLKKYYEAYSGCIRPERQIRTLHDRDRELYMAKRLRELSFSYDKILVVVGMSHVQAILTHLKDQSYPQFNHAERSTISVVTYPEESTRELMGECGWISTHYETWREETKKNNPILDRQKLHLELINYAKKQYEHEQNRKIPTHVILQLLTFARNWAHLSEKLLADLFQLITACKGCVDHNFAYEVWKAATEYSFYKNVDSLPEVDFSVEDLWGSLQKVAFHLKKPSEKSRFMRRLDKERGKANLYPPNLFSICSYPPEDSVIEDFGLFLKKKAAALQNDEQAKVIPFSTSLEDGIDVKETIRHWHEKKLYVKARSKPAGQVGSCVIIFDEENIYDTKHPSCHTWLGEHDQESDMAFYATSMTADVVGPGISRCKYGGFMLSFPNRRLFDVWSDPDYQNCKTKQELLLTASIDYSRRPVIVYVAHTPPENQIKQYAARQGKRILYLPIATFPQREIEKLKTFHILDSFEKRKIADDYI